MAKGLRPRRLLAVAAAASAAVAALLGYWLLRQAAKGVAPTPYAWDFRKPGTLSAYLEATRGGYWGVNASESGRQAVHSLSEPQVTREGVSFAVEDFDPWFASPRVRIDAGAQRWIVVRMGVRPGIGSLPREVRVYWVTEDSPEPGEDKAMSFPIIPDGAMRTYVLEVGKHSAWRGVVTQFRLDLEPADCLGARWVIQLIAVPASEEEVRPYREESGRPVEVSFTIEREEDLRGWVMLNGLAPARLTRDGLTTVVTGFDPYMLLPPLRVNADSQRVIIVGMRVRGNASLLKIYWVTEDSPSWGEDKAMTWPITADGEFHEYEIVMNHPAWRGTVTAIRFDLEPPDCYGTYWAIKYVRIPAGPKARVEGLSLSRALVLVGERFQLNVRLRNAGSGLARSVVSVRASEGLSVEGGRTIVELGSGEERVVSWSATASRPGYASLTVELDGEPARTIVFPVLERGALDWAAGAEPPGGCKLCELSGGFAVVSGELAVLVPRSGGAYAPPILALRGRGGWELVGTLQVEVRAAGRGVETYLVAPSSVRVDGGALKLEWGGEGLGVALSLVPLGGGLVGCEAELRGAKGVLHFSLGLHAGEPGFGASKSEALFPGLEWLEGGEPSSSNVTVPPPYNLRAAPHPLKVTVPLMAVRSGDALVALLWSPLQGGGLVAPQFASPNFVEGQANHLMRVFVPPASAARENRDEAEAPVDASREPLRLKAFVYAARATSVLEAVRRWVELFGLPEPSMPRGLEDELRLCARAYLESMWVPGRGWPHAAPGWEPEPYPGYANLLILMACAEPDAQLRQNLLSRAREALELAERRWGPSSLVSGAGCHVPTNQLPFLLGHLEEGLAAWWEHVRGIVLGQGSDGEWGFQPSERPCGREVAAKLGAPGAREVGITATFAAEVLRYARVTGDQRALRAGLRALAAMERYRVPRGAQTWEIHVRAPDLLAAAKALEAYLEGYIATGNATYLERAKYWALAGLPFIYLWSTPDRPVMAYATIPVYASSCLAGPGWFGVPVQWNGLVYAYHLLRLSRYDASFPWAKVAEGILASAMRQQVAVGGRKPLGSYPDSWNLLTNVDQPPYINPEGIAKLALELLNVSTGIETAVVGGVHASAPARIARAELQGGALRLVLQPSCSGWAYVLVSAQAAEVRRGGRPLPKVEALDGAGEGWKVVEAPLRATLIKLSTTRGEEVVVEVALAARG